MEESNPAKKEEEEEKAGTTNLPAAATVPAVLTDDLIVEILSRVPARSVHRFKCVSPSWRDLIADPGNRKKLPQTLAGFLYDTYHRVNPDVREFHFASVSATAGAAPPVDPSLPFLPRDEHHRYVAHVDTCNGLLLCLAHMAPASSPSSTDMVESHYVVCNPATARWVDLPPHPKAPASVMARLAFDPAVSPHFHVLQFAKTDQEECITGVDIYSSRTGAWNHRETTRSVEKFNLYFDVTSVFFRGMLHLLGWLHPMNLEADVDAVLVAVDMEGQVWETIRVPSRGISFGKIGLSQGCLHYATTPLGDVGRNTVIALVWHMKDYDSKEWVLKHTVCKNELGGITSVDYKVAAIHPDCDTIFLDSCEVDILASYDMQRREFRHIRHLEKYMACVFLPYVPFFSDSLAGADGQ